MLDADYLYNCTDEISALYADFEHAILIDIARRIKKTGTITDTVQWQLERANAAVVLKKFVIERISKLTNKSEKEIKRLFKAAGIKSVAFDNSIYEQAGLIPIPLDQNAQAMQVLVAGMLKTNNLLKNLTSSTATTAQQAYFNAADLAYMQVSSGAMDYNSAIVSAIKTIAKSGLDTIDYATGHRDQIDVAVRRSVLTGVSQTAHKITELNIEDMGVELVETSQHYGAREGEGVANHKEWQGKVFSYKGNSSEYPDFRTVTGYGTGAGLGGWNCRHSFFPFFEGSKPLNPIGEKPDITYNGKKYTYYEATQRQRAIERNIRRWKRERDMLEEIGADASESRLKVLLWQKEARSFVKASGITRRPENERVV
jgi:hypothetical protein